MSLIKIIIKLLYIAVVFYVLLYIMLLVVAQNKNKYFIKSKNCFNKLKICTPLVVRNLNFNKMLSFIG